MGRVIFRNREHIMSSRDRPPSAGAGSISRRAFLRAGAAAGLVAFPAAAPADEKPRRPDASDSHDDPDLCLFIDDEDVEKVEHLRRVLNRPRKRPDPVLAVDKPWDRGGEPIALALDAPRLP